MAKFWKTLSTIEEIIMVIGMVVMVFFNAFNVFIESPLNFIISHRRFNVKIFSN